MRYKPHAVYLMFNAWSAANYKVGMSSCPDRRMCEVEETYENVQPKLVAVCWFTTEGQARKAENIWHRRFAKKRTDDQGGKEWFSLTENDVTEFEKWAALSKGRVELVDWLFKDGANSRDVYEYVGTLFNGIPRTHRGRSIEVWFNSDYLEPRFQITQVVTKNAGFPMQLFKADRELVEMQ